MQAALPAGVAPAVIDQIALTLRAAGIGLWSFWPDQERLEISAECKHLLGFGPLEIGTRYSEWMSRVHPEDIERVTAALAAYLADPLVEFRIEVRLRHRSGEYRWYVSRGALVDDAPRPRYMHGSLADISDRKREEADRWRLTDELHEADKQLRSLMDNVPLLSLKLDRKGRVSYCNEFLLRTTGWNRVDVEGHDWFSLCHAPEEREALRRTFADVLAHPPEAWGHTCAIVTRTGEHRQVQWSNMVLRSPAGAVIGTASIGEDVTERRTQQRRIERLSRTHDMMNAVHSTIVRARRRSELFHEACRIGTEIGRFKLAWIGLLDDATDELAPVATHGDDHGAAASLRISRRLDGPNGLGPNARALRTGEPQVCRDVMADEALAPWREWFAKAGVRSYVVQPLRVGGKVRGCLNLLAGHVDHFDDEELQHLRVLAADLAYAMEFILRDETLERLALYDPLTGLANQRLMGERLQRMLGPARLAHRPVAVLMADIDNFQAVNDALGRAGADELLCQLAGRFKVLAGRIHVGRIAADRFAIVVPDLRADDVERFVNGAAWGTVEQPFQIGSQELRISLRTGVAVRADDGADAAALLHSAEAALKHAKSNGRRHSMFTPDMSVTPLRKLRMEGQLRRALDRNEFVLHYQPKVDLATRAISGAEALLRWNRPEQGIILAANFVPLLEETGLIVDVGQWSLAQVVADRDRMLAQKLRVPRIGVNLSALQLRKEEFSRIVKEVDRRGALDCGLEFEVTESSLLGDLDDAATKLRQLAELGATIALDDFGTGHSSLAYLARLPLHSVKIDRSFVISMKDAGTMAVVGAIIALARSLNLTVVAEGVDHEEQVRMLRMLRCDEMQGHLYSTALPLADFATLLRVDPRLDA